MFSDLPMWVLEKAESGFYSRPHCVKNNAYWFHTGLGRSLFS